MDKIPAEEPVKYLVAKVREALAQDPRTNVLDVHVRVEGERVYLLGTVELAARKKALETVVQEILPPGMILVNNVTVATYSAEPIEETVE
ncbi:MAG: BON domain-containing protein [Myxococcales bacterium]|nr:BON domain-containing protein [Myxococcales bacterium]